MKLQNHKGIAIFPFGDKYNLSGELSEVTNWIRGEEFVWKCTNLSARCKLIPSLKFQFNVSFTHPLDLFEQNCSSKIVITPGLP